jgi:DNA repair protein RadC
MDGRWSAVDGGPDVACAGKATRGRAIRELPASERPRERLAMRGAAGLSAAELIGLLWGSGSRGRSAVDLAEDALARHCLLNT